MARWLIGILAVVLALFVLACAPKGNTPDSKSQPAKPGGPNRNVQNQPEPNPNVNQPGPVQGDPSAHDPEPESLEFSATWISETKTLPRIEYSIGDGQIPVPANAMHVSKRVGGQDDGRYVGTWFMDVPAQSGITYGFSVFGNASFVSADCVIVHHGQFHGHQQDRRNCASSYTVP